MNPLVEQIRAGKAPEKIKAFAAEGLLPITEEELIPLQIFLTRDPNPKIATVALDVLQKLPEQTWTRLVEKKEPDLQIVQFCMEQRSFPDSLKERIVLNHAVPDSIVRQMAGMESGTLLDLIINNQVRLLRDPEILNSLERNRFLTFDQKRRIEEFKTEFIFKKQQQQQPAPQAVEVLRVTFEDILARIPTLDIEAQKIIKEVDSAPPEEQEMTDEQVEQALKKIFSLEELQEIPQDTLSTYQRILKMRMGEKIRLALLGNKEERSILIRDSSRQIASMVLRSPKLTDPEMENFSQMRSMDSELLRQMGQSREFLKRYTIIHSLVKNPKTPTPVALNLLKLLRDVDLRNLSRDRNIPEIIRRQSKRMFDFKQTGKAS